jgi:hypothetical protein
MTKKKALSASEASSISELLLAAARYFHHPEMERAIGYQVAGHLSIALVEAAHYLQDHVIDPEGEGLTKRDSLAIARTLDKAARIMSSPDVIKIPFALSTKPVSTGLLKAAHRLSNK